MDYLINQQIEHYQIEALLGEGGMGAVYRALDLQQNRLVALKFMHSHLSHKPQFQQRFAQEAQATTYFNSPAIIKIYHFGAREDVSYIVMEYIPGGSLTSYLKQLRWAGKRIDLDQLIGLAAQVAEGLSYAHQRGIVHRDIKPDNILLKLSNGNGQPDSTGGSLRQAVITDFGLAVLIKEGDEVATNPFMGSLPYMSPEQCANQSLDGRSDIYSLGVMLYQLTTGQLPFKIDAPVDIVKHLEEPPLPPRLINPDLPQSIETVIMKTLAKKPGDRYQTGAELAHVLRQIDLKADVGASTPQSSGESVVTQWVEARWIAGVDLRNRIDVNQTWVSEGEYRLFVAHQWQDSQVHSLNRPTLTIGRQPDNYIVLNDRSVSGHHVSLEQTPTGWQVRDLGSTNGSFLDNKPLEFDKVENWASHQTLQIGPYSLQWQPFTKGRGPAATVTPPTVEQGTSRNGGPPPARQLPAPIIVPASDFDVDDTHPLPYSDDLLNVSITPAEIEVAPGTEVILEVKVVNQGMTVEEISLRVEDNGTPAAWVTLSHYEMKLMPDESQTVTMVATPAQDNRVIAGDHSCQVIATTAKNVRVTAVSRINVAQWEDYSLDMHPTNLQEKVTCRVTISDKGNFDNTYIVNGLDDSDALLFDFEEPANAIRTDIETQQQWLKIPAGGEGNVSFTIKPKKRPWFARDQIRPFEMRLRTETREWQTLNGQVEIRPRISRRLLLFFMALMIILGGCGYLGYTRLQTANEQQLAEVKAASEAELAVAQEQASAAQAEAETARAEAEAAEAAVEEAIAAQKSDEEIAALQAEAAAAAAEASAAEAGAEAAAAAEAEAESEAALAADAAAEAAVTEAEETPTPTPAPTATPVNAPPTSIEIDVGTVPENSDIGTVIGTFTTTDPDEAAIEAAGMMAAASPSSLSKRQTEDTVAALPVKTEARFKTRQQTNSYTYSLVSGTGDSDNGFFTIDGDELKTAVIFDFETQNLYSIRVQTDDGQGGVFEQPFVITISDENDPPEFSSLPVVAGRQDVPYSYNIVVSEPDASDTTLITASTLPDWLTLIDSGNGAATLSGTPTNDEVGDHDVSLLVTDSAGETDAQTFTITIVNINDPPIFSSTPPTEATQDEPYSYSIITTVDPDADDILTITSAPLPLPGWLILVDNDDGTAELSGTPTNDNVGSHNITLQVADEADATDTQTFTIVVENINDAPVIEDQAFSIIETIPNNTTVGTVTANDVDTADSLIYQIVSGNTNNAFTIDISTGVITVIDNSPLDFEASPNFFELLVRVTDNGLGALYDEATITINLTDANDEDPIIDSGQLRQVLETATAGTNIGVPLTATDADTNTTLQEWTLSGGNGYFAIDPDSGQLSVTPSGATFLDYDTGAQSYVVSVTVSDGINTSAPVDVTIELIGVDDEKPVITPGQLFSIPEDAVADDLVDPPGSSIAATDADADVITTFRNWTIVSISNGGDTYFDIDPDTGQISLTADGAGNLDYDTPPQSYTLSVTVSDGTNSSDAEDVTISLTDANDLSPVVSPGQIREVSEGAANGTLIGTPLTATDADTGTIFQDWDIRSVSNGGGAYFDIDADTGQLSLTATGAAQLDYETQTQYVLSIRVSDGINTSVEEDVVVNVLNVNEPPVIDPGQGVAIDEDAASNDVVGTVVATDDDSILLGWTIQSSTPSSGSSYFDIDGNTGQIKVTSLGASNLDYETQSQYVVSITVSDGPNTAAAEDFTITLNDINEAPTDISLSSSSVDEDLASGTVVGTLAAVDEDSGDSHTYALVSGSGDSGNGSFSIVGDELRTAVVFDFDVQSSYSIRVQATDSGSLSYALTLVITINDVNHAPTDITLSNDNVDENQSVGTTIGILTTSDVDAADTHTYSLVSGTGDTYNSAVTIVGNELRTNVSFDYESQSSGSIRVRSTDDGTGSLTFEKVFTFYINDINDAPTALSLSPSNVDENEIVGVTVGTFSTVDPDVGDTTHTYTLVSGTGDTDNGSFSILGDTLRTGASFDFETQNSYSIRVETDDGNGGTLEKVFTIAVNNVNEGPTDITLDSMSVDENQSVGTTVGNFSTTDPDSGDSHTYSLVSGTGDTDNGSFSISGSTLQTNAVFDFETQSSYSIRVRSTDGGSLTYEKAFTISINDINETPTIAINGGIAVIEGMTVIISSAELSATDVDDVDSTLIYTITQLPTRGTLKRSGTDLGLNDTFTQADINANLIQYAHTASGKADDSFGFSVADDGGATLSGQTFSIIVN